MATKHDIRIEMLPAGHGDALLVEYGDPTDPFRMLIDGGPYYSYKNVMRRLMQIPKSERRFELLVVTHIDADHIEGIVRLLNEDLDALGFKFDDIWFNGQAQMDQIDADADALGAKGGEYVQALLRTKGLPWNKAFDGGPVLAKPTKPYELPRSGYKIRVLSPTKQRLRELLEDWEEVIAGAGFESGNDVDVLAKLAVDRRLMGLHDALDALGASENAEHPFQATPDKSLANGSSIAFVLEVGRKKVLFAGDAWADVLVESIDAWIRPPKKLKLRAFKVPHHGSAANMTEALLDRVECSDWLISTNGSYFGHPDQGCIDAIIAKQDQPHLWFNYSTPENARWVVGGDDFESTYPAGAQWRP